MEKVKCSNCDNMILSTTRERNNGLCGQCVNNQHWERYAEDSEYRNKVEAQDTSTTLTLCFQRREEIPKLIDLLDREFSFSSPQRVADTLKRLNDLKLNRSKTLRFWYKGQGFDRSLDVTVYCLNYAFYVVEVQCGYRAVRKLYNYYKSRNFWERLKWKLNIFSRTKKYSLDCRPLNGN